EDGTYTVTFKQMSVDGDFTDVPITIDGDLYVHGGGGPIYGQAHSPDNGQKTMELWFPLVEKAYAQWKGGYDAIGHGGDSSLVMQEVLGNYGQSMNVSAQYANEVFAKIQEALRTKQPVSAGTFPETEAARYTNTGIYADHSYSVLGTSERDGKKYIK